MKFLVKREALLKPLQMITGVVDKKQTLPILSHVRLSVQDKMLLLTGTDLEVELVSRVPLVDAKGGETTVSASKLLNICRMAPEESTLCIELKENDRLEVQAGKGRYTLKVLASDEFPEFETTSALFDFQMSTDALALLIDKTAFAMAQQDVRYYLNGLFLQLDGHEIKSVATDGHRLAWYTQDLKIDDLPKLELILPRKATQALTGLLSQEEEGLSVAMGANHFQVQTTRYSFTTKLVEGKFPDYRQVVPQASGEVASIEAQPFKRLLSRVAVLLTDKYRGARFEFSNNVLTVRATSADHDEIEEQMDIEYEGESLTIGFNVGYLIDYINAIKSEKVDVTLIGAQMSALLESPADPRSMYIVMPMKI